MPHATPIHESLDLLLRYGVSLMEAGAHTSRVERNVSRIARSFGYQAAITIFQRTIMISVSLRDDFSVSHTLLRKIDVSQPINFDRISALSTLSWEASDENLSFSAIKERYDIIMAKKRVSRWLVLLMVSIANASFCRLFEGDAGAMLIVLFATLVGLFLRQEMGRRHMNHMVAVISCSFVSSIIAAVVASFHVLSGTPSIAVAVSVLYLIPGVLLINSVTDVLQGYVLIGLSRGVNAFNLIICIAIGLSITLFFMGVDVL